MNYRSGCPISNLVDLVGDKWSLLIIRDFFLDRNTFKQFMESPEAIATNILTDRLKSLKSKGIPCELLNGDLKVSDRARVYSELSKKNTRN